MVAILLIIFPVPRAKPEAPHSILKVPLLPFQFSRAVPAVEVLAERLVGVGHDTHATIPKTLTGSTLEIKPNAPWLTIKFPELSVKL